MNPFKEILMYKLDVVGKREPMLDAMEKATGRARFTDDLVLPGMLSAMKARNRRNRKAKDS